MASSGGSIDKGHLLRDTDTLLAQTAQYQQRLDELRKAGASLVSLASSQKILQSSADLSHAEKEWLGGPKEPLAWWPYVADKETILREGFIKAYEVALQDPKNVKRIETYWIPAGSSFATVVVPALDRVNLIIVTPPPPKGKLAGTLDQDVFVIAASQTIDTLLDLYANRPEAAKNVTATTVKDVQIFRLKGA